MPITAARRYFRHRCRFTPLRCRHMPPSAIFAVTTLISSYVYFAAFHALFLRYFTRLFTHAERYAAAYAAVFFFR